MARCFTANCWIARSDVTAITASQLTLALPFIAVGVLLLRLAGDSFAHIYMSYRQSQPIAYCSHRNLTFTSSLPLILSFFFFLYRRFHFRILQPINPLRFFLRKSKTWLRRMYQVTLRSSSIISYRARASFSFYFEWRLHIHYPPLHLYAFSQRSQKDKLRLYIIIR